MKIEEIHNELDNILKELGYEKTIDMKWGSIAIQIDFQAGKEVITITERRTRKPNKG
ncbi:MAG: hypothetical protein WDA17_06970 [Sphaerochaetaceae bacterium]